MLSVEVAATDEQMKAVYQVRVQVFVEEQQVPVELEVDEHEQASTHFLLHEEGRPLGAARLRMLDRIGKVERVCVIDEQRGRGGGRLLMEEIERHALRCGASKLKLHAQTHAAPFYARLGYEATTDLFEEAGIPHIGMEKILAE